MKTDRRGFLGAITTLAAAAVVAPAAKVEAAEPTSDLWFTESAIQHGDGPTGWYMENGQRRFIIDGVEVAQAIRDARAEGYERREFIEAKRAESRAQENRSSLGGMVTHRWETGSLTVSGNTMISHLNETT